MLYLYQQQTQNDMKTITKKEWIKKNKDYKSIINGQKYILTMTDKGTALVPVELLK